MNKLSFILLISTIVVFSNCNNPESGGDWSFDVSVDDNTYSSCGDCGLEVLQTSCSASIYGGTLNVTVSQMDLSSPDISNGGYFHMYLIIENPVVGENLAQISFDAHPNEMQEFFPSPNILGGVGSGYSTFSTVQGDLPSNGMSIIPINISSLGTFELDLYAPIGCSSIGDNVEGDFSLTVYTTSMDSNLFEDSPGPQPLYNLWLETPFTVPVQIDATFSGVRQL
jgi:hypothetical protein